MSAKEMNEWLAYWAVEPWGEVRADYRSGLITAMILNAAGAKRKGGGNYQPSDFFELYGSGKTKKKQTGEQMLAIMRGLAAR